MSDYIEWDGTDKCLEQLLIWWGTREPIEHDGDCPGDDGGRTIHCCQTKPWPENYGLQSSTYGPARAYPEVVPLWFTTPDNERTRVEIGDRIHYEGNYKFRLEKR
jgi:hypothetical protein